MFRWFITAVTGDYLHSSRCRYIPCLQIPWGNSFKDTSTGSFRGFTGLFNVSSTTSRKAAGLKDRREGEEFA
jgi:hypothetical protein